MNLTIYQKWIENRQIVYNIICHVKKNGYDYLYNKYLYTFIKLNFKSSS